MADVEDPGDNPVEIPETPNFENFTANMREATEELYSSTSNLIDTIRGLDEVSSGANDSMIRSLESTGQALMDLGRSSDESANNIKMNLRDAFALSNGTAQEKIGSIRRIISSMVSSAVESVEDLSGAFSGGASIAIAGFGQKAVESFNNLSSKLTGGKIGLLTIQEELMKTQRSAISAGVAFGQTFDEADQNTEFYRRTLADTIDTTKSSVEEISEVRSVLAQAFDTSEIVRNLGSLRGAQEDVQSAVNLTNIALLTAAATGTDATKVANMLSQAHLELGESVDTAANAMAEIASVAEGSGLTFDTVSQSIMQAATDLKMWGGTISSVTPIFRSFVESLGEGRKGLATDLLNEYVSGLRNMGLNARALIGTIGGMGQGAGGAIGAGLEMEAALERGSEGMQEITDNLMQTLTQFGGGRIITRQEAITSPELQKNFILQRQLLQQMGVARDEASATQMLRILQNVEKSGMQMTESTSEKLGELMQTGEQTRDSTTSVIQESGLRVQRAVQGSGDRIVSAISDLSRSMGLSQFLGQIDEMVTTFEREGEIDLSPIKEMARNLGRGEADNRTNRTAQDETRGAQLSPEPVDRMIPMGEESQDLELSPQAQEALRNIEQHRGIRDMQEITMEAPDQTRQLMTQASEKLMQSMANITDMARREGVSTAPTEDINRVLMRSLQPLRDRLSELDRGGDGEDLSESQEIEQQSLIDFINASKRALIGQVENTNLQRPTVEVRPEIDTNEDEPKATFRDPETLVNLFSLDRDQNVNKEIVRQDNNARESVERTEATRRTPQVDVRKATEKAERVQRRKEEVKFNFNPNPIEQEIRLKIIPDSESVKIMVDDEHIKKTIRSVEATGAEN